LCLPEYIGLGYARAEQQLHKICSRTYLDEKGRKTFACTGRDGLGNQAWKNIPKKILSFAFQVKFSSYFLVFTSSSLSELEKSFEKYLLARKDKTDKQNNLGSRRAETKLTLNTLAGRKTNCSGQADLGRKNISFARVGGYKTI
jgi:hypothetical protein